MPEPQYQTPILPREKTLVVGTSFSLAACLMYFAALLGIYLSERSDVLAGEGTSWIPTSADLELTAPSYAMWTLLLSVITMQWAFYAVRREDRRHGIIALLVTMLFGIAVLNQFFFIYSQMGLEIDGGSLAAPLIYTITGSYLAMLVVSLVFLGIMLFKVAGTTQPSLNRDGVASAAVFWYGMCFVYFVVWLIVFVAK